MRSYAIALLFLAASAATAQVSVTSTWPAHNATSVPLSTTISVTFSGAVDTTQGFLPGENFFTNVSEPSSQWWSPDRRTIFFAVDLQPATVYFLLLHSVEPAASGGFPVPYCFYWTTGASFPANVHSVSGTVTSGTTGITPENAIVGLGATPFAGEDPVFIGGAVANALGQFTVPYVPDGTWYPLAAKDADLDGTIDPFAGDPIAFGDSVTVSGGNVSGVVLQFRTFGSVRFDDARNEIASMAASLLPSNRELRQFYAWQVDSTGGAKEFAGVYTVPGSQVVTEIWMESFGAQAETSSFANPWVWYCRPYAGLPGAALLDSVVARAERMGGREFRRQAPPVPGSFFSAYARLGALHNTEFGWLVPDTSQDCWGLQYTFQMRVTQDSSYTVAWMIFLANAATGQIVGVTDVDDESASPLPASYALVQNYPNPFNPSTTIAYALPAESHVRIEIFNLLGERVAVLADEVRPAGSHRVVWDARAPSGVYFCRMAAAPLDASGRPFSQVRKMVLTR